jgi:hypothetical protein
LARTLLEQISNDLKSAIPDHAAGMLGQGAALRRFGLFGTQQALQVDVLQATPAQLIASSHTPESELSSARIARVPELHTVQYLFQESHETSAAEEPGFAGLVRRELDWETPPAATEPAARDGGQPRPAAVDPMEISAGGLDPAEETLLQMPEVSGLEFRYYDGSGWASQWNSLTQKSLPVAVEVSLTLKRAEAAGAKRQTPAATADEELTELLDQKLSLPAGSRHRLLVFLPSTALLREARPATAEPSSSRPQAATLPPPVLRPPPVPAPVVPRPPAFPPSPSGSGTDALRSVLPEQWLRSGA